MTAEEFRTALGRHAPSQLAFARLLTALGHPAKDVARSVRRWCRNGPPGEIVVVLRLLDALAAAEALPEQVRELVEVARLGRG